MASDPNPSHNGNNNHGAHASSGYLAADTAAQHSNAYFQDTNNAFAGFDPSLSNTHPLQHNDHWTYDADRLDVSHDEEQSPSLYQGWQSSSHQHNLPSDSLLQNQNAFYTKQYTNNQVQFQNAAFVHPSSFDRQSSSNLDGAYTSRANVGGSNYDTLNSAFPTASVPLGTISPGALQQRPPVQRNASGGGQPQPSTTSTPTVAGQQPQKPLPRGTVLGNFVIITPESLTRVTNFKRLHNFVDIGDDTIDVWSTKSTIPSYVPRKSRNEISKILANSTGVTSKINKKPLRNANASVRKASSDRTNTTVTPKLEINKGAQPGSSPEEDLSDDESDSDASEEETMQAPLPAVRPSKAIDAVRYDTVKTLWRVPYRSATADDIRKGLAEFWDIIRTIRDRWKSDAQAVKTAEEAKKVAELPLLNERVANQREMLEVALTAAVSEGHKDIVEHLAENLQLVLALAQFLRDRTASGDYSGTLSKAILELLSRCKTLTDGVLEKTNISKYLPRYLKRGDESVKALAKRINDNGTIAARKRKELTKASNTAAAQPKEAKAVPATTPKAASPTAGVKRVRPSESTNDPPSKRVAPEQLAPSTSTVGGQVKAAPTVKRLSSSSDTKSQAGAVATPIVTKKATQVTAKPSSFFANTFAGLQAAKKPGTSNNTKPANGLAKPTVPITKPATTPTTPKPTTTAPRPLFSIADTLASVSRAREVEPTPKPEESIPPESAEERNKRLRKEQRRKLRVSFKPDDALVSYRMLTPPLDDEQGSNVYDVRDAGDIDSEGRMFKLHHDDMMDIDDEDEVSAGTMDDLTQPFGPPSLVDFSNISDEDRQKMYIPYGGGTLKPDSPETEVQERREANTLIVVYVRASDIPPTPKEPPDISEDAVTPLEFGKPPDIVLQRLEVLKSSQRPAIPVTPLVSADLAALLSAMPQNLPPPQQPQQQQTATTDLEKIFAQFSQTALPAQITQQTPAPVQQNLFVGLPQPQQPAQFPNLGGFFSIPNTQPQMQQMHNFQQPAQSPGISDNLSAMLASLQQGSPLGGLTTAGMPDLSQYGQQQPNYGQPGYPTNQQVQQQQQYPYENPERRRWIESGGADNNNNNNNNSNSDQGGESWQQQKQWSGANKGGRKGDSSRPPPKFVVQCKYWKEGKCRKGSDCTYLHTA